MRDDAITFRRQCGAFESNTETGGRFYSDTFSCDEGRPWEAVAIADMFIHETFSPQCLTSKRILEQYFRVGVVNPCTMNCRVNVEDTAATEWKRVPAVQFYRVVEDPSTIVKKQLLQDAQSMDARRHGRNAVSISVVFKMDTDEDKINFCRSLMGNRLIDFMRPHAYVHSSTVTRVIERTVVQDDEPDSSQDEDEAEPTSPTYSPTSPLASARPMGTPSPLRSPVLSANPVAGPVADTVAGTAWKATAALQHISNALFDLKETMPDDSYRQLSASLKRSYDQMLDSGTGNNNSSGVELVDDNDADPNYEPGPATP